MKTDTKTQDLFRDKWNKLACMMGDIWTDPDNEDEIIRNVHRAFDCDDPTPDYRQDAVAVFLQAWLITNSWREKKAQSANVSRRSVPGKGEQVMIHVLGRADEHADCMVGQFGEISAGCGPMLGEDFAVTGWPVVVKAKQTVSNKDLVQHLRDLAKSIKKFGTGSPTDRTGSLKELCGEVDEENPF